MKKHTINGFDIEIINAEPCLRLVQYGKGQTITCKCPSCIDKTDSQMRIKLDQIYK